jgi:hypothetical protein
MGGLGRGDWPECVNVPTTEAESGAVRLAVRRDRRFGTESWT